MRIRRKKWAKDELEKCGFYIDKPEVNKNNWNKCFKNDNPIHIELGCGKGTFISTLASQNLNINYIAVDMIEAMLGLSKRNIETAYEGKPVENLLLIRANIENIKYVIGEQDCVQRIYINFCNPWPRGKHRKKRLTHTRQLEKYRELLKDEGEIFFKTDDDGLFNDSLNYFTECGFEILDKTYDLEHTPNFWNNIMTEHEKMFMEQGIKIKALKAIKK